MEKNVEKGIKSFLLDHAGPQPVSFHMPGHKGSALYRERGYGSFLDNIMDCDITEIPGADNLFQTESIIRETMNRYKALYEVKDSYLLINGSSGGLIAAILASVPVGGKLIMARNCHKSIFNALSLGQIEPVYAYPQTLEEYGVLGAVTAEEIAKRLDEQPDASAVILPSPNYYGICSDVEAIAKVVHGRGKILIVDQAHGAHLKFFSKFLSADEVNAFPRAAEEQGADAVINSTHKTLGSFTQTAVLNLCSDRIDRFALEDRLQAIESTSPSYPLMATLDINADLLEKYGAELILNWKNNLDWFYEEAAKITGLRFMEWPALDRTKLNIDLSAYGLNGNQLEEILMEKGIFIELVTGNIVMCMTGIGNKRCDFERLIEAIKDITSVRTLSHEAKPSQPGSVTETLKMTMVPRTKEPVALEQAEGRVCASSVIPYPPGIPIVCPGEVFNRNVIEYIKARRAAQEKVIGLSGDGTVMVGK